MDSNPYLSFDTVLAIEKQLEEAQCSRKVLEEALKGADLQIKQMGKNEAVHLQTLEQISKENQELKELSTALSGQLGNTLLLRRLENGVIRHLFTLVQAKEAIICGDNERIEALKGQIARLVADKKSIQAELEAHASLTKSVPSMQEGIDWLVNQVGELTLQLKQSPSAPAPKLHQHKKGEHLRETRTIPQIEMRTLASEMELVEDEHHKPTNTDPSGGETAWANCVVLQKEHRLLFLGFVLSVSLIYFIVVV